ncbi:MAG: hypothetical protein MK078_10540 [Crocinitomicaceae bacterium]|nr:hypothetical protein [Crocinitomicaceae bacterium]
MKFVITLIGLFLMLTSLYAQTNSKLAKKGEQFLKNENYEEGLEYFNSLSEEQKQADPLHDYYVGMIYYYSPNEQELGIPYAESYINKTDSTQLAERNHYHVYYVLAKLKHLSYEFDEAEGLYQKFHGLIAVSPYFMEEERVAILTDVERQIECCKFGRISVKNPRNAVIQNLGDSVNTIYPEYAPVISQDEKLLFFTSRRPDTKGGKKAYDGGYYEDVYGAQLYKGSLFEKKTWKQDSTGGQYFNLVTDFGYFNFHKVGGHVNSKDHDGSIQLTHEDSVLYFYRKHDIWSVNIDSTVLDEPVKLGIHANSDNYEPSLFLSYDENMLFIVSDRPGGYGGLDIYVSLKNQDGTWTEAQNLGPNVNTEYDEDSPYLDPDGKTFYFSSMGHSSMGGYDIFRSKMIEDSWTVPVNLGHPINTPADDIYFTMTSRYNRGYYASSDLQGNGDMDMYRITFADERDPVAELIGYVRTGDEFVPAQSKITLSVVGTDESIEAATDSIDGDYFLLLGHGKTYDMMVETDDFAPYHKAFEIPEQKSYFQLYQEIHHVHLFDDSGHIIGQKITVYNGTGKADTTLFLYDEEFKFKNLSVEDHNLSTTTTDIKFYISQDSLHRLMEADPTVHYDYGDDAVVSFLTKDGLDIYDESSYEKTTWGEFIESGKPKDLVEKDPDALDSDVRNVEGLFFTVQIGVYSRDVPHSVFFNLKPINTQHLENGRYRYSIGQFSSEEDANERKNEIVKLGIADAFVTAYHKGERIGMTEARRMIEKEGAKILFDPNW